MIKIYKFKGQGGLKKLEKVLDKRRIYQNKNLPIVSTILREIKKNKNKAILKYEKKYSDNNLIKPTKTEIKKAIRSLDPKIKKAIDYAYKRIFKYHSFQKLKSIDFKDKLNNRFQYKYFPINKIGIYVPANLPSTLLMNAIPAKIAGVKKIILANPRLNEKLNPAVMYVARKLGIKEIYSIGGAQAIGSLAYIQKVDKIIGPGNLYVAKAKKEVFGDVGIEGMVAGPSEITVVADKDSEIKVGNALPLSEIPVGIDIHNVELQPGAGGKIARAAGAHVTISGTDGNYSIIKMTSGEVRKVDSKCLATIGVLSNPDQKNISIGKAGRSRWLGRRPHTRGVVMNPVDHPHGGGEGKTAGGRHPVSPTGVSAKGLKTRDNKRTDKFIIRRRGKK